MTGNSTLVCNTIWQKGSELFCQDIKSLGLTQEVAQRA